MKTLAPRRFTPTPTPAVAPSPVQQVWFTTAEAASYCRMSTKQLLRYATSGRLDGEQLVPGGRWRFHITRLDALMTGS